MRDVNRVHLSGRLGREVELKVTPEGKAVANFSLACNRSIRLADGSWEDRAMWFRVVAWGDLAERCANRFGKGAKVFVEGRFESREWTNREGEKRTTLEIIASDVLPLEKKPGGEGAASPRGYNFQEEDDSDNEVPF